MKKLEGWKRVNKYNLSNDQQLKSVCSYITDNGVISLFEAVGQADELLKVYDLMLRDYKNITENLKLVLVGKVKRKDKIFPIYIIKESKGKAYLAHGFFKSKEKLYVLIAGLDDYKPSMKQNLKNNKILIDMIDFMEVNS